MLAVVVILLGVLLAASALAIWGLRTDTGAAGTDRLSRQLFDCAEQGLAYAKQYFSTNARNQWSAFLNTDVCASLPCPPFPTAAPGPALPGYPTSFPFTQTVNVPLGGGGTLPLEMRIGMYNNVESPISKFTDNDNRIFVYARCREPTSNQMRAVQALITVPPQYDPCGYGGQAGGDCRNSGNFNR